MAINGSNTEMSLSWMVFRGKEGNETLFTVIIQILSNLVASNNISVEYIVEKPGANVDWGRLQVTVFLNRQLEVVI